VTRTAYTTIPARVANPSKRPAPLVAVCIIGLVLATLFVCDDLLQVAGQVGTAWMMGRPEMQQLQHGPPGIPGADAAESATRQTLDLQNSLRPILLVLYSLDFVVSALLIAGAAMTLSLSPIGRRVLMGALVASLGVNVLSTLVRVYVQWRTTQITQQMFSAASSQMPSPAGGGPPIGGVLQTWLGATTAVTLACIGIWLALKASYYLGTLVYLHRQRALFAHGDQHQMARSGGMPRG